LAMQVTLAEMQAGRHSDRYRLGIGNIRHAIDGKFGLS
jgi:hypothetical protein